MEQSLDDRLRELETRSSFQEATIEDLSAVVVEQSARIERLIRLLLLVGGKARAS